MFERVDAAGMKDLMLPMSQRSGRGVFFVRVCGWNAAVRQGVWAYHEAAAVKGAIIEGQISNPDDRQLSYLNDVLGTAFEANERFLDGALTKWMPRMSANDRRQFTRALLDAFADLRRQGKTEGILRSLYFKVMCWLYYRFERLMPFMGDDDPPRVLYECTGVTAHELLLLRLLNALGADIMLLEPSGDAGYLRHDPDSLYSQLLIPEGEPFPRNFTLKGLRREMSAQKAQAPQPRPTPPSPSGPRRNTVPADRVSEHPLPSRSASQPRAIDPMSYFKAPRRMPCTNAWMQDAEYTQILIPPAERGDDPDLFYNAFVRVAGVRDRTTYLNELHQFYLRLTNAKRRIVIAEEGLSMPEPAEVDRIRRRTYRSAGEMIVDLAGNLPASASPELQKQMQRSFVTTMTEAEKSEPVLSRLLISAVYLLCWIRRFQGPLFSGYKEGDVPCFVLMGGCRNAHDVLYPLFLSHLPADVLILSPDLQHPCQLKDERLLEIAGEESLPVMKFPRDAGSLQVRTLAAHAQDDLTDALYTDTGLYRDRQFSRAESLTLQTTYDELFLLWDQELKYRSGFDTLGQTATLPVLYAKVCGVEKGKVEAYWQKIRSMLGKDTHLVRRMPMLPSGAPNPYQALAVRCLRDGRLKRGPLRDDRLYPFSLLREDLQQHMLDKLQLMLDRRLIRGTYENGTEYTVTSTVLNMDKSLLRMLQSFDFTKKNPKLLCIDTGDGGASLEDAILITFLNLVGFDVVLFVPTGYQTIERYLNDNLPVEHQAGEYMYDLVVPDLSVPIQPRNRSWLSSILKRGN